MIVMITGAAGFIGSQIAYRLYKDGAKLILVDNFSYGSEDNLLFPDKDFRNEIFRMDIRNKDGINYLMHDGNIDCIYHIAGIAPLPDCQINPQEAISVNIEGTVNVLENARVHGVRKIVFASTNAIYENDRNFPTKEEGFVLPSLIYPNTKYAAERFCQSYCDVYGMNITCLRFANVYGPHIDCLRKQPPFVAYMIRELYYNRTPVFYSDGEQRRDYIYVDDLVDIAMAVRESKGFEYINVSSSCNYSVKELYAIAKKIMNKNIEAKYMSSGNYWLNYPGLYGGAYPIKNEVLESEVNKCTLSDNSVAKAKYSWSPKVDIEQGLERVIEYETKLLAQISEQ